MDLSMLVFRFELFVGDLYFSNLGVALKKGTRKPLDGLVFLLE